MNELIYTLQEETELLNILKHEHDLLKLNIEQSKIKLKYSDEYKSIKTIKEREERALMECEERLLSLADLKDEIRQQELRVEIAKLEIQYDSM